MKHTITDHIFLKTDCCTACGSCMETCPKKVLDKVSFLAHKHAHVARAEACIGCLKCVKICPQQAVIARRDPNDGNRKSGVLDIMKRRSRRHFRGIDQLTEVKFKSNELVKLMEPKNKHNQVILKEDIELT